MPINKTPCASQDQLTCGLLEFFNATNEKIYTECYDACPLECESYMFSVSTSSTQFPSKVMFETFFKNFKIVKDFVKNNESMLKYDTLKDKFILLNIFFEELKYMKISEVPSMTPFELISNIGGTLGLFLGYFLKFRIDFE